MAKMRFSQHKGITPVRVEIQRESMDEPLRNKLWSAATLLFFDLVDSNAVRDSNFGTIMGRLWLHFFKLPLDTLPPTWFSVIAEIRGRFFKWDWYEVYDFVEALAQ